MKLLICSDSHGNLSHMLDAVETESPDTIIHLGDMVRDADDLAAIFPHIPFKFVSGNCDGWTKIPPERFFTLEGVSILIGHGHTWHVKSGMHEALHAAHSANADLLLFGHTHIPICFHDPPLWVLNPGSISGGRNRSAPSYGIVMLENGKIDCSLSSL